MRCELRIECDTPEHAAQVASTIAAATGRGVEERQAEKPPSPPIPGPTVRDAVAGMLLRCGFPRSAKCLACDGWEPADLANEMRHPDPDAERTACIAALEALAAREACRAGRGVDGACGEGAPGEQVGSATPDREALGRAAHEAWLECYRPNGGGAPWEDLDGVTRECERRIGERLFAMGVAAEHERFRDAIWEVKGILGAPSVESLKTHAEKVKAALFSAVAEARENKDALERADAERQRLHAEAEALRKRVAELEAEHQKHRALVVDLRAILDADPSRSLREEARRAVTEAQQAREQGAAEMRERAADAVCSAAHEGAIVLVEAEELVRRVRALPLAAEPTREVIGRERVNGVARDIVSVKSAVEQVPAARPASDAEGGS